mgnify:FL=1
MSLYQLQKVLFELNRDSSVQAMYKDDSTNLLDRYDLTYEERQALLDGNIGLLYVLGVNGQILMHFAAFLEIQWFDYLELMREGVKNYGPVRAGIYAMTGDGSKFVEEDNLR